MDDFKEAIQRLKFQVDQQLQSQKSIARAFENAPQQFEQFKVLREIALKQAKQMESLQLSFSKLQLTETNIFKSMKALSESFRQSLELAHKMRRNNWANVLDANSWHYDYSQAAEHGWAFYDLPPTQVLNELLDNTYEHWPNILINRAEEVCSHAELLMGNKNCVDLVMYENALKELIKGIRITNWISVQALSTVFISSILEEFYLKTPPAHGVLRNRDELYSGIHEIDREVIFMAAKTLWPGKENEQMDTLNRNKSTHYLIADQYKPEHAIQLFITSFALYIYLCNNPDEYRD